MLTHGLTGTKLSSVNKPSRPNVLTRILRLSWRDLRLNFMQRSRMRIQESSLLKVSRAVKKRVAKYRAVPRITRLSLSIVWGSKLRERWVNSRTLALSFSTDLVRMRRERRERKKPKKLYPLPKEVR